MITELSAALSAIKEALSLAKVISDAKTDAEVKVATSELQSRLATLSFECTSLSELIRLKDEENMHLCNKIKELEDFETESVDYVLNQTEAGSFVYSKQLSVNGNQLTINACANCFHERKISILQPVAGRIARGGYFIHFCPSCNVKISMSKIPRPEPIDWHL
ncbi:hypothetical protein [Escherichia coli]|uniref:hypothetical protein n=1 Tax=Escherichia coli TaxID=562 RepID=UPI001FCE8422|nr:hypothetical protein [Escherichia coli]